MASGRFDDRWGEPPPSDDGLSAWWVVILLAAVAGGILYFTQLGDHKLRILAMVGPTALAGFLGMALAGALHLRARLAMLGVALLLAVPAYLFVPTGPGVSYVQAKSQLADLLETPVDSPKFRARFADCLVGATVFRELQAPVEQVRQKWGQFALKEMQAAAQAAERGNAPAAKTRMAELDLALAKLGPWDSVMTMTLGTHRYTIQISWLRQVPLAQLKALPGGNIDDFERLRTQFSGNHAKALRVELRAAERDWAAKAVQVAAKEALARARKDDLTGANDVLGGLRHRLGSLGLLSEVLNNQRSVDESLNVAKKQVVDVVWRDRLNALRAVPPEDVAGFHKRRALCRTVVASLPEMTGVLQLAEKQWLEKSARAAADSAEKQIRAGNLDEAFEALLVRFKALSVVPGVSATQAPATLTAARGKVLTARLDRAAVEMKKLSDARESEKIRLFAQQAERQLRGEASAIGAEKELRTFLARCVTVILRDECRAVEKLLATGDGNLDAAAKRIKQIARDQGSLLGLAGGPDSVAEFVATRRRVAQAHLNKVGRDLAELEKQNKHSEMAQRAER